MLVAAIFASFRGEVLDIDVFRANRCDTVGAGVTALPFAERFKAVLVTSLLL